VVQAEIEKNLKGQIPTDPHSDLDTHLQTR
jgi:hypothetical protein